MTPNARSKRSLEHPSLDLERYRAQLLALQEELNQKIGRNVDTARNTSDDQPDTEDQSVVGELRDEYFTLAQTDSQILTQVRNALQRIDDGSYGRCIVDGVPIEPARLDAVPWAPYCAKHQEQMEAGIRTPRA